MTKDTHDISIVGRQFYDDDTGEVLLSTTGVYTKRGSTRFIAYREYEEDNPSVSHTALLKVEDDKVTMSRSGTSTRLILERGQRHLCLYDTGFGGLTVGVFTSQLDSTLEDEGGKLDIKYTLDVDSSLSSRNEIQIEVRKAPQ